MPDNAAIYISDPTMLGSRLLALFPEIRSVKDKSDGDNATGMTFDIGMAVIDINFMPSEEVSAHLQGFMGYVQHVLSDDRDSLIYVLSRIQQVGLVMGCVIEPGFDDTGIVEDFLIRFCGRLNGLLFIHNNVLDFDGKVLV